MVLAKFEIASSIKDVPSLSFESLFPPPSLDKVYRLFLLAPYVVTTHDILQGKFFGYPVLDIPIYSHDKMFSEILPLTRIVLGDEIFCHWGDLYSQTPDTQEMREVFRGKTEKFTEATCVKLPISPPRGLEATFTPDRLTGSTEREDILAAKDGYRGWLRDPFHRGPLLENVWPSQNLFFDEPIHAVAGNRLSKGIDEVHRGYWILWSAEEVYISQIVDEFYYVSSKLGCHFRIERGEFVLRRDLEDCKQNDDDVHTAQMALFLMWTRFLDEGKAKLVKVQDKIFHFYWQKPEKLR
jgi:hypothetical protein